MSESALLLDSNIVVWLDQRPDRLPPNIVRQIAVASKVYVSAVTAWELGIKQALGSLSLTRSVCEIIGRLTVPAAGLATTLGGYRVLALSRT